jgi:hypothetical protein
MSDASEVVPTFGVRLSCEAVCVHYESRSDQSRQERTRYEQTLSTSATILDDIDVLIGKDGIALHREQNSSTKRAQAGGHYLGGFPPEIITTAVDATISLATATAAIALLKTARSLVEKWLDLQSRRSVRVEAGDRVIEIKGSNDIDAAIAALERLQVPLAIPTSSGSLIEPAAERSDKPLSAKTSLSSKPGHRTRTRIERP